MSKVEVTFTLDVAKLRADKERLEGQIKELHDELTVVRRKLEAVEVLAPHALANGADSTADDEDDRAPTTVLYKNMIETGDALKPGEIRTRLHTLGFADKMKDNPNFGYGVTWRLVRRGLLVKKGQRYRAVSKESPAQGGTGVLGTPVKH